MGGYFSSDGLEPPAGSPITNLTLLVEPFDWISVSAGECQHWERGCC